MFAPAQVGEIRKKTYEGAEINWEILDLPSVIYYLYAGITSPVFSFADVPWYFKLVLNEPVSDPMFVSFSLECKNDCAFDVEVTYGLKKQDGNMEYTGKGIWKKDNVVNYWLIRFDKLIDRKKEFTSWNVLTIKLTLKRKISQPTGTDQSNLKKLIKLRTLSDNFRSLFASKENFDKTLVVQGEEYKAHEAVLVARSPVFAAMFKHDTLEKQMGIITIPDCDSDTFQQFLEFLYCGQLEEISFCSVLHLYETSDKYDVQELKTFCVEYLVENMTEENFREVVIMADRYGDTKLFTAVQDLFNKNLIKILDTSEWKCLLKDNYGTAEELLKGMAAKMNALVESNATLTQITKKYKSKGEFF